ncbi:tripartite tricarboxylate transporter substrate binding protein [Plastoroseomonas hellenica]|uniref:tripartite tricarboxylate transporter substrate binding protein n=1 Tax=Plastoroseomonas hellenica TaxID=2687306 RepID=UPI001BA74C6D|nr:tripartite tricarboxylate transporter substrate binding protein [Plastoroseomonas hellenica]MBR0646814.1 tripartite tricarboxylate transporter substrate binding protein [Plastoroseomonas hellenica]
MTTRRALLAATAAALPLSAARAQRAWPERPIRMLVGYAPGGGVDIVARLLAEPLRAALGQPVLVENRPGAGAMIAAQAVARGADDGHTLLMAAAGEIAVNPSLFKQRMTYDPARELQGVALVAAIPNVIVAHPSVPARSPAELLAYARANPGKLSFASAGIGNPQHLAGEMLNRMAGTDILHVPYRGSAPALTDVAAGRVTLNFSSLGAALPLIRDGRLHAIAVTSRERMPQLPEVPALAETPGLESYELVNWFGLFAPAAMPAANVERLHATVAAALRDRDMASKLAEQGGLIRPMSAAEFRSFVGEETRKFARIVEEADIRPEG